MASKADLRAMMKKAAAGRKKPGGGVDIAALKALRQSKKRKMEKQAARAMPPPPPSVPAKPAAGFMPPPSAPGAKKKEKKQFVVPKSLPPPPPPAPKFQKPAPQPVKKPQSALTSIGAYSDDDDDTTETYKTQPVTKPLTNNTISRGNVATLMEGGSEGPAPENSSLPAGFFDNAEADAKAHNIDLKAQKKSSMEDDWKAFQDFSKQIEAEGKATEDEVDVSVEDEEARGSLEQMTYVNRVQHLLDRAAKMKSNKNETQKATETVVESDALARIDDTTSELHADMGITAPVLSVAEMMKKKRKEKKQRAAAKEEEYTALDPLDWRSKLV
jgi:hypothetical protein